MTDVTRLLKNTVEATTIVQNFVLLLVENVVWKKYQKEQDWYKKKWKKNEKMKKNGKKKNTRKKGGKPQLHVARARTRGNPLRVTVKTTEKGVGNPNFQLGMRTPKGWRDLRSLRVTFHNVTSGQKAPLWHTQGNPKGSHVTFGHFR